MVLMKERRRLYTEILTDHLQRHRQMALVSGPRQVGKTTACRSISDTYLNWDNIDDRRRLLRGPAAMAEACPSQTSVVWGANVQRKGETL